LDEEKVGETDQFNAIIAVLQLVEAREKSAGQSAVFFV